MGYSSAKLAGFNKAPAIDRLLNPTVRTSILLAIALGISLVGRLVVYRDLMPTSGDPFFHLIQAREIIDSSGIPVLHTLYFPGTLWNYPPLFQLILSLPIRFGAPPLQTVFLLGLAFDVLEVIPLFLVGRRLGGSMVGCLAAILYSVDAHHMLTWGGYPNLMAMFLITLGVFFLWKSNWKSQVGLATTVILIGLSHDISLPVVVAIICMNATILFWRKQPELAFRQLLSTALGLAILGFWYVPKLQIYLSFLPTGSSLQGLMGQGIVSVGGLFIVTYGLSGLLVLTTPIMLTLRPKIREASPIVSWFLAPLPFMLPFLSTPNIPMRFLYYSTLPALVMFAYVVGNWIFKSNPNLQPARSKVSRLTWAGTSKGLKVLLLLLIVVCAGWESIHFGTNAHDYYKTEAGGYDPALSNVANWYMQTPHLSGTTVAPLTVALYIGAVNGDPVIPVGDPIWYAMQSEREMTTDGRIMLTTPPSNQTFRDLACKMNVTYLVFEGAVPSWVIRPNEFERIQYVFGNYTIVSVRESC